MNRYALALLLALLLTACLSTGRRVGFDYGTDRVDALAAYDRGWEQIMDQGRWTAAEASFRRAAEIDPDWVMGAALLARITRDVRERESLLAIIEGNLHRVDTDTRLLVDVYVLNIRAANARDRGEVMPEGFLEERRDLAVENLGQFVERHPGEAYIQAEFVEWIHSASGPEEALTVLRGRVPDDLQAVPFFYAYAASLEAELARHDAAEELALAYAKALDDPEAPGLSMLRATLLDARGEVAEALSFAEAAVALDPRHLLAVRLRDKLRAQLRESERDDD